MNTRTRVMQALASLLLLLALAFPLWTISLQAPQYPEGIGLKIWANRITGQKEHDLHNINGLNHYIGMQVIEPDSIPELRILPPVILGFAVLGLLVAALGRRKLLGLWLGLLLAGGLVGLADFWKWEYDYGHNLNPEAAIQVPGMSYQPPLIGTRQLLNMRTTALPGVGGLAVAVSLGLGLWAFAGGSLPRRKGPGGGSGPAAPLLMLGLLGFGACSGGPRDIDYGHETCVRCRMQIMDDRYGAELVTRRGKVLVFDSAECLVAHLHTSPGDAESARAVLVTHVSQPGVLVPATASTFLHSEALPSPMGLGLSACATPMEARELQLQHGGRVLDWADTRAQVRQAWKLP